MLALEIQTIAARETVDLGMIQLAPGIIITGRIIIAKSVLLGNEPEDVRF